MGTLDPGYNQVSFTSEMDNFNCLKSHECFKLLFTEYYNPVCQYIYQIIRDRENSEEIAQQTFIKLWENREKTNINTSLKSYLFQSARNTAIDFIRKLQNEKKLKAVLANERISELQSSKDEDFDTFYRRSLLFQAIQELKPKRREIFKLHKLEGLTYKEISEHLNISKRAVEDNISKAMELLKNKIKDKIH